MANDESHIKYNVRKRIGQGTQYHIRSRVEFLCSRFMTLRVVTTNKIQETSVLLHWSRIGAAVLSSRLTHSYCRAGSRSLVNDLVSICNSIKSLYSQLKNGCAFSHRQVYLARDVYEKLAFFKMYVLYPKLGAMKGLQSLFFSIHKEKLVNGTCCKIIEAPEIPSEILTWSFHGIFRHFFLRWNASRILLQSFLLEYFEELLHWFLQQYF